MQPTSKQPTDKGGERRPTAAMLAGVDGRVLVDELRDPVVVGDLTYRILHVNPAAERLLGWRVDELVGLPLTDIVATDVPEPAEQPTRLAALRRDGSTMEVDLTVTHLGSDRRGIVVAILRDISDRLELERQLRSATYLRATTQVAVRLALGQVTELAVAGPLLLAALHDTLAWDGGAVHEPDARGLPAAAAEVLATGRPVWTETAFAFPIVGATGPLAAVQFARQDPGPPDPDLLSAVTTIGTLVGRVLDAGRMQQEVQNRLAFLARSTSLLEASLDLDATLARVADLAVPYLADACIIELCHEDELIRAAAASRDRRLERALRSPDHAKAALRTGQPQAYGPGDGIGSAVAVPLVARGDRFGVMSLGLEAPKPAFGEAQLTLAVDLAQRAALAVDGARRFTERSYVAMKLQDALLPRSLPEIPGIDLGVRYTPAGSGVDVGGDFYDVFDTGDGAWGVVIGDVVGKGVEAAALTGVARHTLRALALHDRRPEALLDGLNRALLQEAGEERYCTACYVRIVPVRGGAHDATIALAGHPEPVVLRADGTTEEAGRPGTLLGAFDNVRLESATVRLQPGDALVLYTDGVTERHRDDDFFDTEGLRTLLSALAGRGAGEVAAEIERAVVAFDTATTRDDLAVVVIRVRP